MEKPNFEKIKEGAKGFTESAVSFAKDTGVKAKETLGNTKNAVVGKLDQNGDKQITIEDIIIMGLKVPGIKINREAFLRKEFANLYPEDTVNNIIKYNPLHENIGLDIIDKVSENVIQRERLFVSGISTALGAPGGVAMVATIPADIAQYYGYMLRAAQELMYLYGFPQIDIGEEGAQIDSGTMNLLILCMGVMYGVAGANNALKAIAKAFGQGVEKKLLKTALTKGTIYPIVKSAAKWFNVKITKTVFAGFFKNAIPVIGGALGGGLTYATFKPCCEKLKKTLRETKLANKNAKDDIPDEIEVVNEE